MNKIRLTKNLITARGYCGKILWVNLTDKSFEEETLPESYYEEFIGGYGIAAKIIFERQKAKLSKFDPDNILAFMSGLLTNGKAVFNGRWMLAGKSPLTGTWGDSNCGGTFSPTIKGIGYDGIFFIGKSDSPVYLFIDNEKKELLDANYLWGKDTTETEEALLEEHGINFKVACIGQGGENLSLISGVVHDKGRIAARSGLGALMGSKNLKALILRGNMKVEVFDEDKVWNHTSDYLKKLELEEEEDYESKKINGPDFANTLRQFGTAGTVTDAAQSGDSPIKNWEGVVGRDFDEKKSNKINGYNVTRYEDRKYHCERCPIGCGGICSFVEKKTIKETHRPEYETLCGFGTQLLNDDIESIFKINEMLNRAGIDSISCATTVNWAFEAFEKGLITIEDTGGLELKWGDSQAIVEIVQKIIAGEGIGSHLMNGLKEAELYFKNKKGKDCGVEALHVLGQELPMHDSRNKDGGLFLGIGYITEPTPGRHTSTLPGWDAYVKENGEKNPLYHLLKFQRKYKDNFFINNNNQSYNEERGLELMGASCAEDLINALGLCNFGLYGKYPLPLVEWINCTTGWNKSISDYLEAGKRIKTIRHAFNIREGIEMTKIKLPKRAQGTPPLKQGKNAYSPNILMWDDAQRDYFIAMGWDIKTGLPSKKTLRELNLKSVEKVLYNEK
jgi:aldehyde:ferredoxin oxidoreductase